MTTRTTSKSVTFAHPFLLKGVDRILGAGDYRVVTDEELIQELSFAELTRGNPAKTEELSEKIDNLEGRLGPDFMTLVHALTDIDAHSQEAREIRSILEALNKLCED
jgi:hypothetical protein